MKKVFIALVLIFGIVFVLNTGANALPYPDLDHSPIGPEEFPDPNIVEGSGMVSNLFDVTAGTEITFNYNLITDEFDEEGADVNDYFGAMLLDPLTNSIVEMFYIADIYTSTFSPISEGTVGPHGSYFTYQTGVLSGSLNISSAYTDVALAFGVFDIDDAEVDTGVILDNISGPVPFGDFENGLIGAGGFIIQTEWDYMYGGNVHLLAVGDGFLDGVSTTGFSDNYAYMSTGPEDMPPVVPEPISSTLFLIGGATLGFRRFRKTKVQ